MVYDRATVTMANQYKVIYGLSNRAIFSDLERPQIQILRSGHTLALYICEMVKGTGIVTMEGEGCRYAMYHIMVPLLVTLSDL